MYRIALFLLSVVLLVSCSSGEPTPEARAMEAAQQSYTALSQGNYEQFLAARADVENMPSGYREELLTAYRQFASQQTNAHGGIALVEALRAEADSTLRVMQVFLTLHYGDSTHEEIVVPMVELNGQWKLK